MELAPTVSLTGSNVRGGCASSEPATLDFGAEWAA